MRFVLSIDLGNDAMRKPSHVAAALHDAARAVRNHGDMECPAEHRIHDLNGNTVGKWEVIDEPAKPQVKRVWALAIDGDSGTDAAIFTDEMNLFERLAEEMEPTDEEKEKIAAFVAANDAAGLADFVTAEMELPHLFTYCIDHLDL